MKKIWAFISQAQNLAVLTAIGAALGFAWKEFIPHTDPVKVEAPAASPPAASAPPPSAPSVTHSTVQTAKADSGGIAINASGAAQVHVNGGAGKAK